MDYNQNRNNENGQNNQNWDRWNSTTNNSSYHNQPTHSPYQKEGFAIASLICGILAITSFCTGFLSLPLGALGVLFAILSFRTGKKKNYIGKTGVILSCVGMISAVILIISSFAMLPTMMKNEAWRQQMNTISQQMYGMDFTDIMEEYYGYTIEE